MTEEELSHLLDTLGPLEPSARAMFGGHGIYSGETFFAIYFGGRLYFRVDDETRRHYVAAGMEPFEPPNKPATRSYYEVPDEVLASPEILRTWAQSAVDAAARS